jgi:hypothetical protein
MARDSGMELYGLGKNRARFVHHLEAFAKLVAEKEREACVKECKKLLKVFLSSKYSTGQPLSSFKERHAVAACIESIEARGQA